MSRKFETELSIQPRDVDINGHVHHTVYLDYLLTARFDQMERCYGMSMQKFWDRGLTWVARHYDIEYRSGLLFGDRAVVRTWIDAVEKVGVTVAFEIFSKTTKKIAAHGQARYILVNMETHRPRRIPPDILELYSV